MFRSKGDFALFLRSLDAFGTQALVDAPRDHEEGRTTFEAALEGWKATMLTHRAVPA